MSMRRTLLRQATVVALAAAIVSTSVQAPVVSASPLADEHAAEAVRSTMNKPKDEGGSELPGLGDLGIGNLDIGSGDGELGDIPIVGDLANTFKDAEPEEVVAGAVEVAGFAVETVVPLIRGLVK
jgi:hypothetical protein